MARCHYERLSGNGAVDIESIGLRRIMSQKLDLSEPLWGRVVEGLEGGRFAIVNKLHPCMVDGISAVNALPASFPLVALARSGAGSGD